MITNFYVDGFNLYYRALKGTQYKWLDLRKLAETLFPDDSIHRICYFTALLYAPANDPSKPRRQLVYLRALQTLPDFSAYFGTFRPRTKTCPLVHPIQGLPKFVEIHDTEEKGTDVHLATRLLVDGFNGDYEQAVIVSNDSDLAAPIRYVRDELGRRVTVVNPDGRTNTHKDLEGAATYVRRLWRSHLRVSQFSATLEDSRGTITKPPAW